MDELSISGGRPLRGEINISGAKNAVLPELAACLLAPGVFQLSNVPNVRDVRVMCSLLETLGARCHRENGTLIVNAEAVHRHEAPYDLVRKMRASVLLLGPLLARFGRARVSLPGGCAIGVRPVDIHLKALQQMGATVNLDHGMIDVSAESLHGGRVYLDFPTVTGTENVMIAAMGASGETEIQNAAKEPEIIDLADMLQKMGAGLEGVGTDTIRISPPRVPMACVHTVIPDRIEAGTYVMAAAITGGDVRVKNLRSQHLDALVRKLQQAGIPMEISPDEIHVMPALEISPVDIETAVYPGYPTDLQAQFTALMCVARGNAMITETIFENRFMHVAELNRMGADIVIRGNTAVVKGPARLAGAQVMATDLRASASLVLAGLAARGETQVLRIYHLDRGYENLVGKLQSVGADIQRVAGRGP